MKRNILVLFGMFLLVATCWNCKDETATVTAVAYASYLNSGSRAPDWETVFIPNVLVSASISGNPMLTVDYVQVANKKFVQSEYFQSITNITTHPFTSGRIWKDSVPNDQLSPLTISIHTSNGILSGSIVLPDTIQTLTVNTPSRISQNGQISLTWTGTKADFYVVRYYINMYIEGFGGISMMKDTLLQGQNFILGSSDTGFNGEVSHFEVYPINGPMPVKGAKPNMTGDGYGYLFAENRGIYANDRIVVGDGMPLMFGMPAQRYPTLTEPPQSVGERLKQRYLTLR